MSGVVLYHGPSMLKRSQRIVAVATLKSANAKTGDMVQVWILPADCKPYEAVQQNANEGVCGRCPFQGRGNGLGKKIDQRVCYVDLAKAPSRVWDKWRAGGYPKLDKQEHRKLFEGRKIRLGAYGEPAALPVGILRWLVGLSSGHTGYTHSMFDVAPRRAKTLAKWLMVSTEEDWQDEVAHKAKWRTFRVSRDHVEGMLECPHYTHGVECKDCLLCDGAEGKSPKSIYVRPHGAGKGYFNA